MLTFPVKDLILNFLGEYVVLAKEKGETEYMTTFEVLCNLLERGDSEWEVLSILSSRVYDLRKSSQKNGLTLMYDRLTITHTLLHSRLVKAHQEMEFRRRQYAESMVGDKI